MADRLGSSYSDVVLDAHLSEDEVSNLIVDKSALGEVDEAVWMEVGVPVVSERQVGHVQPPKWEGKKTETSLQIRIALFQGHFRSVKLSDLFSGVYISYSGDYFIYT